MLPIYCAEILEDNVLTKTLINKLNDFTDLINSGYLETLHNQPYRLRLYLELYLAKYLNDAKKENSLKSLKNFETLLDATVKYIVNRPPLVQTPYEVKSHSQTEFDLW